MLTLTDPATGTKYPLGASPIDIPVGVLREGGCFRFVLEATDGGNFELLLSDRRLEPTRLERANGKLRIEWDWAIDHYSGEVELVLLAEDRVREVCSLDVSTNPQKLGSELFREMSLDLQEKAEGLLFGLSPAHTRLDHDRARVPPIGRFSLLRTYLPELALAFRTIEEAPHRRLEASREERPLPRVRRVDGLSLRAALSRMPVLAALQYRQPDNSKPPTLDVPRREHTFDTSPNRHLLVLFHRLVRVCADLSERFRKVNGTQDAASSRRFARWADLAAQFGNQLARMRSSPFLDGIEPAPADSAALLTVARHPAYSRFDRLARRVLDPCVALGADPAKRLGLRSTFDLYEYWTFFAVADSVRRAFPEADWPTDPLDLGEGELLLRLLDGTRIGCALGDATVEMIFQGSYSSRNNDLGQSSISKTCKPDIVLNFRRGRTSRTYLLDAKYRAGRESIQAGLDDIDVYRDAIRDAVGQPAIAGAFILTPAHASGMDRYYSADYRRTHRFGGFDLAPRNLEQARILTDAIRGWFDEFTDCRDS